MLDQLYAPTVTSAVPKTSLFYARIDKGNVLSLLSINIGVPLDFQVASQRISSVDLSCCSLEHLPANLFYSQDLTHLNLKQNFLRLNPSPSTSRALTELQR